jgi:hypothetical protein
MPPAKRMSTPPFHMGMQHSCGHAGGSALAGAPSWTRVPMEFVTCRRLLADRRSRREEDSPRVRERPGVRDALGLRSHPRPSTEEGRRGRARRRPYRLLLQIMRPGAPATLRPSLAPTVEGTSPFVWLCRALSSCSPSRARGTTSPESVRLLRRSPRGYLCLRPTAT